MKCPHGEIDASCCLDCLDGPPPVTKAARISTGMSHGYVVAQYEGLCPVCEDDVLVGDRITEQSPGRWGHVSCE